MKGTCHSALDQWLKAELGLLKRMHSSSLLITAMAVLSPHLKMARGKGPVIQGSDCVNEPLTGHARSSQWCPHCTDARYILFSDEASEVIVKSFSHLGDGHIRRN